MYPALPFTAGVLEPLMVVFVGLVGLTSIVGNAHSNASPEI
jgi:hypothetical protein